jgi:hypothetical protein
LGAATAFIAWLRKSSYWNIVYSAIIKMLIKISALFSLTAIFVISVIYLAVMFYLAITHYDLGFDEAWYIYYAKNFASTAMPFYDANGRIAVIDTITMLPHYLFSVVLFKTGFTDIIYFKALSSVFSVATLFIIYYVCLKIYGKAIAVISLLVLIAQPGFGFVASSFFGELSLAAFLLGGLYLWLKDNFPPDNKKILIVSFLFSLAIHTKFQLIFILVLTLIIMRFTDADKKPLKVLLYTLGFTVSIIALRSVPVLLYDWRLLKNQALITDLIGAQSSILVNEPIADKLQKFNRYYPIVPVLVSLAVFFFYMRSSFERFLFFFTSIIIFWVIFLYPANTYRNPFMGIVTLCIIIAILLVRLFETYKDKKPVPVKYAAAVVFLVFALYGFSTNIIYAYIGYNDGVEFDLDAARNRLFYPLAPDNTQKEFYNEMKKIVLPSDTLYNGTFVTHCYLNNPVANYSKLKQSLVSSGGEKFVLITREVHPFKFEEGYKIFDSLAVSKKLVLKKGDFELYSVTK